MVTEEGIKRTQPAGLQLGTRRCAFDGPAIRRGSPSESAPRGGSACACCWIDANRGPGGPRKGRGGAPDETEKAGAGGAEQELLVLLNVEGGACCSPATATITWRRSNAKFARSSATPDQPRWSARDPGWIDGLFYRCRETHGQEFSAHGRAPVLLPGHDAPRRRSGNAGRRRRFGFKGPPRLIFRGAHHHRRGPLRPRLISRFRHHLEWWRRSSPSRRTPADRSCARRSAPRGVRRAKAGGKVDVHSPKT